MRCAALIKSLKQTGRSMRISSLSISNFRSIRLFKVENLTDAVVVAGPNGCGKSSIFDAIRLLKSSYGQYRTGELQQWFSEFQIDLGRAANTNEPIANEKMFFDVSKDIEIAAKFEFDDSELEVIRENSLELYKSLRLSSFLQRLNFDGNVYIANPLSKQADREIVEAEAKALSNELLTSMLGNQYTAKLVMERNKLPKVESSPLLTLLFSVYRPSEWGVIDYHSPTRSYAREQFNSVQLNLNATVDKGAQHALYQTAQKYTNIKQEMASSYIMELVASAAGQPLAEQSTLQETLKDLFNSFFPGKRFVGVRPKSDGALEFPIELLNGKRHDIDELSSGEKEVLLGYLRLRNSTPKRSILLLDEPEMHLNPRLARSLPRFYEKHLSKALDNQLWMVTHSDAILREAVAEPGYSVCHMQAAIQTDHVENQATQVNVGVEAESAIISLTGDLATYNPRSKVVLLEGENSEFDLKMISQLFPDFIEVTNPVSMGSSRNVKFAHRILSNASSEGKLGASFFSIVDRDYFGHQSASDSQIYQWDRYHIENYLLEPRFIREALRAISMDEFSRSEEEVEEDLRDAAAATVEETVRIQVTEKVNSKLMSKISLSYDFGKLSVEDGLIQCIDRSWQGLDSLRGEELSYDQICQLAETTRKRISLSIHGGTWKNELRGRNVLKKFVDGANISIQYEQLRGLVISRMKEARFQPLGMKEILDRISER